MKFVKLKVEHFCGIASAEIEFGPGLNILYGPNELGKSSLAEAIRAALLVQTNSSAHHPWITWEGHDCPFVELIFRTRDLMYWRIRKSFGKGGNNSALLDESKDGVTFSNYAKGRRADGELRKLLKWGIPEPGGQNRVKGMPSTFLTSLLLPRQDGVHEIFGHSLDKDFDDSGKKLVTDALQALAADPLFTHVLNLAQAKVDDVFDAKGNYRKRQNSALRRIQEEISQAEEVLRDLSKKVNDSQEEKLKVEELQEQQLHMSAELQEARDAHSKLKEQWEKQQALEKTLNMSRESLKQAETIWRKVADLMKEEATLQSELQKLEGLISESGQKRSDAERKAREAQEALQRASSAQSEAERQIKKRDLENRRLELNAKLQEASRILDLLAKVRAASETLQTTRDSLQTYQVELTASNESAQALESDLTRAQSELAILEAAEIYLGQKAAEEELEAAKQEVSRIKELREQAEQKQAEAEAIRQELDKQDLPDEKKIEELRNLSMKMQIAETALEVGLSAALRPSQPLQLNVSRDGETAERTEASESVSFTADQQLRIDIEGIAEIHIKGGKPEAREEAEVLKRRWQDVALPLLERAGVQTLEDLHSLCRQAREKQQQAVDFGKEISAFRMQLEAAGDVEAKVARLESRASELRQQFIAKGHKAEEIKAGLTPETVLQEKQETAAKLSRLQKEAGEERLRKTRLETLIDSAEPECVKNERTFLELKQSLPAESKTTESIQLERSEIQTELNNIAGQIAALASEESGEVEQAEKNHREATRVFEKACAEHITLTRSKDAASSALANCRTELRLRREEAEKHDLDTARKAVKEAEDVLAGLASGEELSKQLTAAKECVQAGEHRLAQIGASLQEAQGMLKKTGGSVIIERKEEFSEALERKVERQEQIELEYAGWKRLLDAMKEIETDDASHLGQAITSPVANRFKELTRDRYGELELGPNLESGGIHASGQARDIVRLSIGTRDQLSTIFRLALAEHLDSVLVLDDQLAQSDALRMAWFREQLRTSASKTQILVFTCRHEDYLSENEMPAGEETIWDSEDGMMRSVKLKEMVEQALG